MAAAIDETSGMDETHGGYGSGARLPPAGAFIGMTAGGTAMRWAAVEGQDMELRKPAATQTHAKDVHTVEYSPLTSAATRISDILAERYPWQPEWNAGIFDPVISPTQTSVAFGRRAWTKLVNVLTEPSTSTEDRRSALVALVNRVARPESRSSMVRAGAVAALSSTLRTDGSSASVEVRQLSAYLLGRLCDSWEGRRALEATSGRAVEGLVAGLGGDEPAVAVRRAAAGALARLAGSDDGWEALVCGAWDGDLPRDCTEGAAAREEAADGGLPVSASRGESGAGASEVLQRIVDACAGGACPEAVVCLACVGARHEEGAAMLLRAGGMRVALELLRGDGTSERGEPSLLGASGPFVAGGAGRGVRVAAGAAELARGTALQQAALSCLRSMTSLWVGRLAAVGAAVDGAAIPVEALGTAVEAAAAALHPSQPAATRRSAAGVMLLLLVATEGKRAWWTSEAGRGAVVAALADEDARVRRDADLALAQLWQLPESRRPLARAVLLARLEGEVERSIREAGASSEGGLRKTGPHSWEDGVDAADASLRAHRGSGESARVLVRAVGLGAARDLVGLAASGLGAAAGEEVEGEGGGSGLGGATGERSAAPGESAGAEAKALRRGAARALALLASGHWGPGAVGIGGEICAEDEGEGAAAERDATGAALASRARQGAAAIAATLRPHARLLGALSEAGRAGDGSLCADLAVGLAACLRESAVLRRQARGALGGGRGLAAGAVGGSGGGGEKSGGGSGPAVGQGLSEAIARACSLADETSAAGPGEELARLLAADD